MKTLQKILVILLIAICVFAVMPKNIALAADSASSAIDDIEGKTGNQGIEGTDKLTEVAGRILTFLQIASGVAAVIMIAVTGFRYIVETPEVKGELKKNMFPIIVGIILVFFATSIAKFFIGIFNK